MSNFNFELICIFVETYYNEAEVTMNYIKYTNKNFIIFFILIFLSFNFLSYYFFISNFELLEKKQNKNNIHNILFTINSKIDYMKNITYDYASWDDTFNYMNTLNQDYVDDNFGDGLGTLEGLNIDFVICSNLENKTQFSKYQSNFLKIDRNQFENKILQKYKKENSAYTVFKYNSFYFYLIKTKILKSDSSGEHNGYLYMGNILTVQDLSNKSKIFSQLSLEYLSPKDADYKINNANITVTHDIDNIYTNIQLFDNNKNYMLSLLATNPREIIHNGTKTIIIYNIIVSIFLLIIFYTLYKNKLLLQIYNENLKNEVEEKTIQLNKSIKEIENQNKKLYHQANKDFLTNIDNRRSFYIKGKKALKESIKNNTPFSLLMMDLDNFKNLNDSYGHDIGDKVLIEFCNIINDIINKKSIFGRVGGEEFIIIFTDENINEAYNIADSIRIKCEASKIETPIQTINFTVSFGLSQKENLDSIDKIIQQSDKLLYKAKKSGKNKIIRTSS